MLAKCCSGALNGVDARTAEIDGEIGDAHVGLQARLMSQAMRKLTSVLAQSNTLCIFTNQMRDKIGVMFGNPETTPGGKEKWKGGKVERWRSGKVRR